MEIMNPDWGRFSPELVEQAKDILRDLALLSEVRAGMVSTYGHHDHIESPPPAGVRLDRDSTKPPPKDRSLYEWYSWHFPRARNDAALEAWMRQARYEWSIHSGKKPEDGDDDNTTAVARVRAALRRGDEPEEEAEATKRVVSWYEGDDPQIAALKEGDTRLADWIRKARRMHRRDEETGRRLAGWRAWDEDRRIREIEGRRIQGWSQERIAGDLEVSLRTVQTYYAKVRVS